MTAPAVPIPTKTRCAACDGFGCPACEHHGWTLAPIVMNCPTCDGAGRLCEHNGRPEDGFIAGEWDCEDCSGLGTVPRPCCLDYAEGCERPAVRWPEGGDPICAEHDLCDLCDSASPVLGERYCARCASHLADVVEPGKAA